MVRARFPWAEAQGFMPALLRNARRRVHALRAASAKQSFNLTELPQQLNRCPDTTDGKAVPRMQKGGEISQVQQSTRAQPWHWAVPWSPDGPRVSRYGASLAPASVYSPLRPSERSERVHAAHVEPAVEVRARFILRELDRERTGHLLDSLDGQLGDVRVLT